MHPFIKKYFVEMTQRGDIEKRKRRTFVKNKKNETKVLF